MRKVRLPSGSELQINVAPFADSKLLYQAMLEEVKGIKLDMSEEVDGNFFKDIFCAGFSSKKIEAALNKCVERCLYEGEKISDDTFEPEKAREDYFTVLFEVAQENVKPFTKSLYAQFKTVSGLMQNVPA